MHTKHRRRENEEEEETVKTRRGAGEKVLGLDLTPPRCSPPPLPGQVQQSPKPEHREKHTHTRTQNNADISYCEFSATKYDFGKV